MLLSSAALSAAPVRTKMSLAIHQITFAGAGYRKSLEGCAQAGVKSVELSNVLLDEFLKTGGLPAARRILTDLGLTALQGAAGVTGLWEPNPNRSASFDQFEQRCEMFADLGLKSVYCTTVGTQKVSLDDYKTAPEYFHRAAEIARRFNLALRIEFVRSSSFISTLPTLLNLTRAAAHANLAPMLDFYHFWSGLNKLEDLDLLKPGELAHAHFQDVPALPRELLDNSTRVIPGDGIAPLDLILGKLSDKGYAGPLSVELFLPKFQQGDPVEAAREIKRKSEAVMRRAGVLRKAPTP